jgi:hypothetical protein
MHTHRNVRALALLPAALLAACSADVTTGQWAAAVDQAAKQATDATTNEAATGNFGISTTAVFVVNPQINEGSTTTIEVGTVRGGVSVALAGRPAVTTTSDGLAVYSGLPTGDLTFALGSSEITVPVVEELELYDVIVAVDDNGARLVVPPIRYPIGGTIVDVEPGDDLRAAVAEDDVIVRLAPGTYPGDLTLSAERVLVFGSWDPVTGPLSILDGNVDVRGGGIRIRGVRVSGTITANANGFSAAFCEFAGADIKGNGVTLIRNVFAAAAATVPSSNAVLVDNLGIP